MKPQPIFSKGQKVVFMGVPSNYSIDTRNPLPTLGATYTVTDNCAEIRFGRLYISVSRFSPNQVFGQDAFAPSEDDRAMNEEIEQALLSPVRELETI